MLSHMLGGLEQTAVLRASFPMGNLKREEQEQYQFNKKAAIAERTLRVNEMILVSCDDAFGARTEPPYYGAPPELLH